jgi:hypothetical protein
MDGKVDDQLDLGVGQESIQRIVGSNVVLGGERTGSRRVDVRRRDELDVIVLGEAPSVRAGDVAAADDAHAKRTWVRVMGCHARKRTARPGPG